MMFRQPRGSIYHPHMDETITLGTLMVEDYERPKWQYNKVLYIEKEGFSEALKDVHWPERHDCMLMSSKGFTTRAARDLVDKLAKHDEPVTVFCVHDDPRRIRGVAVAVLLATARIRTGPEPDPAGPSSLRSGRSGSA
jgi:hypothetical protein